MMQSSKKRGDVLVAITEKLSRHNILSVMNGPNSQALTPALIKFLNRIKMPSQSQLIVDENLQNITKLSKN